MPVTFFVAEHKCFDTAFNICVSLIGPWGFVELGTDLVSMCL